MRWLKFLGLILLTTTPCLAQAADQRAILLGYALYYPDPPSSDPAEALRGSDNVRAARVDVVDSLAGNSAKRPRVQLTLSKNVAEEMPPPDESYLHRFGHGITAAQSQAIGRSKRAAMLMFKHNQDHAHVGLRTADRIAFDIAKKTGAFIYDPEIRVLYSVPAFQQERLGRAANARSQIVIHAYQEGEAARAVTLGMSKFGAPDLVVEPMLWSMNEPLGFVMVGVAQLLIEGDRTSVPPIVQLDPEQIRDKEVREYMTPAGSRSPLKGKGRFNLVRVQPKEGDAENALFAIRFGAFAGANELARQNAAVTSMYGWEAEIQRVNHDDELESESRRAKAKLPALRDTFRRGLQPGEFVQVKAPFATPNDEREWMWVEVLAWDGDQIRGMLKNEPHNIPTLHGGQEVNVSMGDVFDYIHTKPDGTQVGNTTEAIIMKLSR